MDSYLYLYNLYLKFRIKYIKNNDTPINIKDLKKYITTNITEKLIITSIENIMNQTHTIDNTTLLLFVNALICSNYTNKILNNTDITELEYIDEFEEYIKLEFKDRIYTIMNTHIKIPIENEIYILLDYLLLVQTSNHKNTDKYTEQQLNGIRAFSYLYIKNISTDIDTANYIIEYSAKLDYTLIFKNNYEFYFSVDIPHINLSTYKHKSAEIKEILNKTYYKRVDIIATIMRNINHA